MRQRDAHGRARGVAEPATTAVAAELAQLTELPDPRREAAGASRREHPVLVLDRVVDLAEEPTQRDGRPVVPGRLGLFLPGRVHLGPDLTQPLGAAVDPAAVDLALGDQLAAGRQE